MTVIKLIEADRTVGFRVYQKGACEIILDRCNSLIASDGSIRGLEESERKNLKTSIVEPMTENGLRTICVAYKDYIRSSARKATAFEVISIKSCVNFKWNCFTAAVVDFKIKLIKKSTYLHLFNCLRLTLKTKRISIGMMRKKSLRI